MVNLIEFLNPFYQFAAICFERIWLVFCGWLIWPGLMFWVGLIGESRMVPIGRYQAKAFMPGDLSFSVAYVALLELHKRPGILYYWEYSRFWWLFVAVLTAIIALLLRGGERQNYPSRAFRSPTKITHDGVGYFIIPLILIGIGLPRSVSSVILKTGLTNWLVFLASMLFYTICVIIDVKRGFTKEDVAARHPADWQPIWRQKSKK